MYKYKEEIIKEGINVDDFWNNLVEGYIKPEKILIDNNKIEILKAAIEVLSDWQEELEKDGLINYY